MWGKLGKVWDPRKDNRFGTDEFLWLCKEMKAEPVICINAGSAGPDEAAESRLMITLTKGQCGLGNQIYYQHLISFKEREKPEGVPNFAHSL